MSWLDKIQNERLEIVTGDGTSYLPLWKEARKNLNYNTSSYDFIGVQGTLIDRKEVQGAQFPFVFYFQGDDCIEKMNAFEESARDKRAWILRHPLYGESTVQPLSIEFDNSVYNQSKVSGTLWETIDLKYPQVKISPPKEVEANKSQLDTLVEDNFVNEIDDTLEPSAIKKARNSIDAIYNTYVSLTEDVDEIAILKDGLRKASSAATNILSDATSFINEVVSLINFPFLIVQGIGQKADALLSAIDSLVSIFIDTDPTDTDILIYEAQTTTLFSELSQEIMNSTQDDYPTRQSVLEQLTVLSEYYYSHIARLDEQGYNSNTDVSLQLDYIVNVSFAYLYDIAFSAKQERKYILEKESNLVTLAHRFVGPGDVHLKEFIDQNEIKLDEYFTLLKGRQIIYYV